MAFYGTPAVLARAYVKDMAETFGGEPHAMPTSGNMTPYLNGAPLRLEAVLGRLELWAGPMARFIAALERFDRDQGE